MERRKYYPSFLAIKVKVSIPYDSEVMSLSDEGKIYLHVYKNGTPVSEAFNNISDKIIKLV
jgi:hypothetical protein